MGPLALTSPLCSQIPFVHVASTAARSWETKRSVVPSLNTARIRSRQRCWKVASPTARTSSTSKISGSRYAATAQTDVAQRPAPALPLAPSQAITDGSEPVLQVGGSLVEAKSLPDLVADDRPVMQRRPSRPPTA